MQITLSYDNFVELPYTSGTIQNISPQATVEICQDGTANTGLILGPGEWFSWSNSTIYARSAWDYEPAATCAVVPFLKQEEGGGSEYILPVATTSTLGGVKSSSAMGKISVNSDGTMSVNGNPNDGTPTGTVISFFGITPPTGYLACDGTAYNITDYQALADHINAQFGSYSYFGGDGTTTFAVPDLRGEFLRGAGPNSHAGQGNGASVGAHQDGTEFQINAYNASDKTILYKGYNNDWDSTPKYVDAYVLGNNNVAKFVTTSGTRTTESSTSKGTSRPTNTSVLYCIKC